VLLVLTLLIFLLRFGLLGLDASNRLDQSQQSIDSNSRGLRALGIYQGIMAGRWNLFLETLSNSPDCVMPKPVTQKNSIFTSMPV
jgi:hypothetical protein